MTLIHALALSAAIFAAGCPGHGDPTVPGPTDPPVDAPDPIDPGGSGSGADSGTALQLCLANFEALNPELPPATVQQIFCSSPTDLAPWARQAIINTHPRALAH